MQVNGILIYYNNGSFNIVESYTTLLTYLSHCQLCNK